MLPYMLCASRFAHYLKVRVRDKVGSFAEAGECDVLLRQAAGHDGIDKIHAENCHLAEYHGYRQLQGAAHLGGKVMGYGYTVHRGSVLSHGRKPAGHCTAGKQADEA